MTLGTRDLAQLFVYWFTEGMLPDAIAQRVYTGMVAELESRGKSVQTLADEQSMNERWVRQVLHRELDRVREDRMGDVGDASVELDQEYEMLEPQQESLMAESEQEAVRLLELMRRDSSAGPAWESGGIDNDESGTDAAQHWWDACEEHLVEDLYDAAGECPWVTGEDHHGVAAERGVQLVLLIPQLSTVRCKQLGALQMVQSLVRTATWLLDARR